MSSFEKLIERFVYNQNNITINNVRRLLNDFGYTEKKKPGSECTFHKRGSYPVNVPTVKGRHVKKAYVKGIVKILGLEEYLEEHQGG